MFTNQGIFDYIKGQSPDMFVERNKKNVSSTVGATRYNNYFICIDLCLQIKVSLITLRGRAPICL